MSKEEIKQDKKEKSITNPMREIKIEKIVLSIGAKEQELEKGVKLLTLLSGGRKPMKTRSTRRIPSLGVRPNLELGCVVTIRKNSQEIIEKMLSTIDNTLKKKQISENNFSFGIKEYIEIPGIEYQRDIGIMGFDVTIVFKRTGRRVKLKKVKKGKIPKRQKITKEEIIKFMEEKFETNFV